MKEALSLVLLLLVSACGGDDSKPPADPGVVSYESVTVSSLQFVYNPTTNIVEFNPYRAIVTNNGTVPLNNLYFEFRHVMCSSSGGCIGNLLRDKYTGSTSLAAGETKEVRPSAYISISGLIIGTHEVSFLIDKEAHTCSTCTYTPLASKVVSFVTHT